MRSTRTYKIFSSITTSLVFFCLSMPQGWAEEKANTPNPTTKAADKPHFVAEDPGPVYTQMIRQWAQVTDFSKNATDVAVGRLKMEIENDPKLQKIVTPEFIADLKQFFYELFISPELMSSLAKLYSQYFTLDEMGELIKFYQTPLGQKLVKNNTELTLKSQLISLDLLKKNEKKYMQVVAKYMKGIKEEGGKPAQDKKEEKK